MNSTHYVRDLLRVLLDRPYETRSRPLLSLAPTTVISAIAGSIERNDYGLYYFELQIKGSDFSQDDPSELEESYVIGALQSIWPLTLI